MTLQDGITPNYFASDNGIALNPNCGMPSATSMQMPSISATAASMLPSTSPNTLTIQDLNQRLPSIVQSAPIVMAADAGCTDPFSKWVADNSMLAGLGLLAVAWFAFGGKK